MVVGWAKNFVDKKPTCIQCDRLIFTVHILNKTYEVDAYPIDLTRTQGEDQSYNGLFAAIEQMKNGHIIDVMQGKYNKSIFKPFVDSFYHLPSVKSQVIELLEFNHLTFYNILF